MRKGTILLFLVVIIVVICYVSGAPPKKDSKKAPATDKKDAKKPAAKKPVKKPAAKKPVKKPAAKKPVKKPAAKKPVKKPAAKKAPAKKKGPKKPATKKGVKKAKKSKAKKIKKWKLGKAIEASKFDYIAQAFCVSKATPGHFVYAVRRKCSWKSKKNFPCSQICSSPQLTSQDRQKKAKTGECAATIHFYTKRTKTRGARGLGLKAYVYNGGCDATNCGPNYCCCQVSPA